MLQLAQQMQEAAAAVRSHWSTPPRAGVILGSGLGELADAIEAPTMIEYADVPHFPQTTAQGHAGRLVCGELAGLPVIAFQGRFHMYEGHSAQTAALPVRLLQALGADLVCVSNAAGGLSPSLAVGDIMLIDDQINLMFRNPLVGVNDDDLGPRFPDMSSPYDHRLQQLALESARRAGFPFERGVYVGVLGPTYETRAEYRMLARLGGDAVGMSTVPENVAARHAGMRVLGMSIITNAASSVDLGETTHDEVVAVAGAAGHRMMQVVCDVFEAESRL